MEDTKGIDEAFTALVSATNVWGSVHMDQWEKFKFETEYGLVYVTISRVDTYPDTFDLVNRETGKIIKQAGL